MQNSNRGELEGMFDDDDLLSTFDHFDEGDINGDELLEALSNHDDNLFDDIDVDNDVNMSAAPPPLPQATPHNNPHQSFSDSGSYNSYNNNNVNFNNSFTSFEGAPTMVPVAQVNNNFRRRHSGDHDLGRPSNKHSRRRANKKKSSRANISSNEPLFGGGHIRRQSHGYMSDDDDFSESDVASACSAPADLMALCGLYDDPSNTPDVLDVQHMFMNPINKRQQQQQQQLQSSATNLNGMREMMFAGGGQDEETMLIRQRQQQLLQEERQLQEAAASQRPRRRKTFDGTMSLPLMDELRMNMMQVGGGGGGVNVNHMYGDTDMNAMPGNNVQIKRRKSEPFMMDIYGEEMNGGNVNNNRGGTNLNHSSHSLDHMMGFPSSYHSAGMPSNNAGRKSALDVAVEEAQEKINHLKQLLYVSQNSGGSGGGGGVDSGQIQQQQQQSVTKGWWASLASELGGTGLNLNQSNLGSAQGDLTIPTKAPKKPKKKPKKKPEQPAAPAQIPLPDKPDPEILKLDPTKIMKKLQESMSRTTSSMKQLQEWDRANGLPKSHSQTMVNSNKSRKQLAEGTGLTPSGSKDETKTDDEVQREKLSAMHAL